MAHHHIDETTLLEYATGALAEPLAVLAATHLALCPTCRNTGEMLERAGGSLIEDTSVAAVPDSVRDAVFGAINANPDQHQADVQERSPAAARPDVVIPRPLRDYLSGRVDSLAFKRVAPGLEAVELLADFPEFTTRLMRITAGKSMPRHTHDGDEFTLVLDGGFSDSSGVYHRGDVAIADSTTDHRPVALQGDDCICLAVTAAPVRLTGRFGRLLNPFIRF